MFEILVMKIEVICEREFCACNLNGSLCNNLTELREKMNKIKEELEKKSFTEK
jgi:hypothetical protein